MLKHIAIGIFIPYCAFIYLYVKNRFRIESIYLARLPLVLLLCGIWSFVPSILKHVPVVGFVIADTPISNIFFFYGILRNLNTGGTLWGLTLIFCTFFSLMMLFARHLGMQEEEIRRLREVRS